MNEFSLIDRFFKAPALARDDVIFGIGDDAACLQVPSDHHLLVSTDTLVAGVHFLSTWDAYDIAWRAVMVNVSDMAAMAAEPRWATLALTLPAFDESWLDRFSQGLHKALREYGIALIGGDTTQGPLSLTLTLHGTAPAGKAVRRQGARAGDVIWVSGQIGAAALAVSLLDQADIDPADRAVLMDALLHPKPRTDLIPLLRAYATAAIDISDGFTADLNHICQASGLGASLSSQAIPAHPLLGKYHPDKPLDLALYGGDDYELCFTCSPDNTGAVLANLNASGLSCYPVGQMDEVPGLRMTDDKGVISMLQARGYTHFK